MLGSEGQNCLLWGGWIWGGVRVVWRKARLSPGGGGCSESLLGQPSVPRLLGRPPPGLASPSLQKVWNWLFPKLDPRPPQSWHARRAPGCGGLNLSDWCFEAGVAGGDLRLTVKSRPGSEFLACSVKGSGPVSLGLMCGETEVRGGQP